MKERGREGENEGGREGGREGLTLVGGVVARRTCCMDCCCWSCVCVYID